METTTFDVRPAQAADMDALAAVLSAAYRILMAPYYTPEAVARALPAIAGARGDLVMAGQYYVAVDDSGILGAGGWSLADPDDGARRDGVAHLRKFATRPDVAERGGSAARSPPCAKRRPGRRGPARSSAPRR